MVSNEDILNKLTEVQGGINVAMSEIGSLVKESERHEELISGLYDERNKHNDRLLEIETSRKATKEHKGNENKKTNIAFDWIMRIVMALIATLVLYDRLAEKNNGSEKGDNNTKRKIEKTIKRLDSFLDRQ